MNPTLLAASKLPVKRTPTHIYFFGHEGPDPEVCLQQWHPSHFTDPDLPGSPSFSTTEHYMMYGKALLFGDKETAERIMKAEGPDEAKRLGREVRNFDRKKWEASCDDIVERGNFLKFSQNPEMRDVLLKTGSRVLVEASPEDRIWGVGFDSMHAEGREAEWGRNRLGEALMRVRRKLGGEEGMSWKVV